MNPLRKLLKQGKPIVNGWLMLPCPLSAEIMARQGYDSLVIDMQHGYADFETATNMFQAIGTVVQPSVVTPMARVTWNEPGIIMRALDAGAYGLICPMISNRAEAESFVKSCLYPPQGIRSFGPVRSSMMYRVVFHSVVFWGENW